MRYFYDRAGRITEKTLPDSSRILYNYTGPFLQTIERISNSGEKLYTHSYERFDLSGNVVSERLLSGCELVRGFDKLGRPAVISSSHYNETDLFDPAGNLINRSLSDPIGKLKSTYTYDALHQLTTEPGHTYAYDSLYNRIAKNDEQYTVIDSEPIRGLHL